jgi:ATP-dependent Clp protease ATP-binding subunit ClpB
MVVFKPLGAAELERIRDIELNAVQQWVVDSALDRSFMFTVTENGRHFLLDQGSDLKYGARHLKRAIERLIVHPMSNLIATNQIDAGDWIRIDYSAGSPAMTFHREAEQLPMREMVKWFDRPNNVADTAAAIVAHADSVKVQSIRSSRRA